MYYTKHRLTDAMLQRLSAIANERPHKSGTSLLALFQRGLVEPSGFDRYGQPLMNEQWRPTSIGLEALRQARRAGW